jgi:hypothetical protein
MAGKTFDLWIYRTPPVDIWDGWLEEPEWMTRACICGHEEPLEEGDKPTGADADDEPDCWESPADLVRAAKFAFEWAGWEGDGVCRLSALPDPEAMTSRILVSVKQGANGECFFASPFRLPWLEVYTHKKVRITQRENEDIISMRLPQPPE